MSKRLLLLETSGRVGQVGVALGEGLLAGRRLDEARRHARDLAPAVRDLLAGQAWQPRDLHAVVVSRGPGSYTGLRVGIMSAKALAYAAGCALVAVDTFAIIARQAPAEASHLEVIADAQKDKLYCQRFEQLENEWRAASELVIVEAADWQRRRATETWLSGPGLRVVGSRIPESCRPLDESLWDPGLESLLRAGLERLRRGERDDLFALEPLYARPSSAEEQWQK